MLSILKKTASIFILAVFAITILYLGNGPGAVPIARGVYTSPQTQSFTVNLQVLSEITISAPSNVTMLSAIYGITGNLGNPASGSTSFTVKTNNATGFNLTVQASTTPALSTGSYNFADYGATSPPDINWLSPAASTTAFGFTVVSDDAALDFWHDGGTTCGIMFIFNDSNRCFRGFEGTTPITIMNRDTNTDTGGSVGSIYFRAESNAAFLAQDTYTATVTVTAATN